MKAVIIFGMCFFCVFATANGQEQGGKLPEKVAERKRPFLEEGERRKGLEGDEKGAPPHEMMGEMFGKMDRDGDGKISKKEFFAGPRMQRLPEEKKEKMFKRLDKNEDGFLSREEIRLHLRKDIKERRKKERQEFLDLDKDGSGGLSFEEFSQRQFMKKLPEERRRQIFGRLDTDGNGELNKADRPKKQKESKPPIDR